MVLVVALEYVGNRVGDIVDAGAAQLLWLQQVNRFLQLAAPIFQIGCRSTHLSDESLEQLANRVAAPGIGDTDGDAMDVVKRGGSAMRMKLSANRCRNVNEFR